MTILHYFRHDIVIDFSIDEVLYQKLNSRAKENKQNGRRIDFFFKIVYIYCDMMDKQINIPNTLSGLRILLAPAIFLLILNCTPRNYPILIALFCISVWLDFFDGYLARKLSQETELGKILDPIADKLMVFFIVVALIIKSNFPLLLWIFIFLRDILILAAGLILMKGKKKITPSILIGKITFASLGFLILVFILDLHQGLDLEMLKRFFIVLSVGFMGWSWLEYYGIYKKEKNAK